MHEREKEAFICLCSLKCHSVPLQTIKRGRNKSASYLRRLRPPANNNEAFCRREKNNKKKPPKKQAQMGGGGRRVIPTAALWRKMSRRLRQKPPERPGFCPSAAPSGEIQREPSEIRPESTRTRFLPLISLRQSFQSEQR